MADPLLYGGVVRVDENFDPTDPLARTLVLYCKNGDEEFRICFEGVFGWHKKGPAALQETVVSVAEITPIRSSERQKKKRSA